MPWKLEGLSEHDARRPLTPTGTNLLRLVKHLAGVELGYLGDTFGRPSGIPLPWYERADRAEVTLGRILVHLLAETHRHAGHADILRELIDGQVGLRPGNDNMPDRARDGWAAHRERVEAAARAAAGR